MLESEAWISVGVQCSVGKMLEKTMSRQERLEVRFAPRNVAVGLELKLISTPLGQLLLVSSLKTLAANSLPCI